MKEEQIIQTAKELFTKYGYKRVSMDEIAKKANVTKKTIYRYFKSKEELLKYYINQEILNMKEIIEKTEDHNISYFDNVHNVIYNLLVYKTKSDFLKILTRESIDFENQIILENLKKLDKEIMNYISERLKDAIDKGYIINVDVEIVSFVIYKMYIALMFEFEDTKISKSKIADNIMKILKDGLERKDDKNE